MDSNNRNTIVDQLPARIRDGLSHSTQARVHVLNIVRTCLNYSGGVESLIEAVRFLEGDSLPMQQLESFVHHLQNLHK
jgi:hypothetical protein